MNIKTNSHFKHLLHTVLLLVMTGWTLSVYAEDEVIFSLTNKIGSAEKTADNATVTEGTSLILSNTAGRIKLTPKAGAKFKNGDKISFSGTVGNSSKNYGIKIFGPDGTTNVGTPYVAGKTTPLTVEGVLTLSGDADYIYIARYDGTTTTLTSCEITRESPTINISSNPATNLATNTTYYIDAQGNYTTEKPASYVATYSCTDNNDHGNQGTVITIPNATEGKYTVVLGGCQYNNGEYTIKSDNGAFTDITIQQSNTAACNDKITRSFLVEKPTTITITGGSYTYLPFFSVVQKVGFAVNITYVPEGSGTVDVDGSLFKNGEEVTMTATPNHGYAFSKWQDATGSSDVSTDNPYSFTMGTDDVTYTAVFNPLTLYQLSYSSEPSDGGSITCKDTNPSHPEGESITLTATPQTGYSFKGWKKGDETVSTELSYTFNMPAEDVSLTAVFDKQYSITFGVGETGALGQVPPVIYVQADNATSFTVPDNNSLYKEGYTLTGWKDGTNHTYKIGESIVVTGNIVLTPEFTPNTVSLSDLTEETTVTWQFGKSNGAPSISLQKKTGYVVKQLEIKGFTIDIPLCVDATNGKLDNSSRSDQWAQITKGTILTVPSFVNTKVKFGTYTKASTTTVDGKTDYEIEGEKNPFYHTSTITSENLTINIVASDDIGYINTLTATYPAQKRVSDLKIALEKENITLNLGKNYTLTLDTDYYTSSTGAISFESSIPSVAEVDEKGVITAKGYGKTIVTLKQEGDANYASGSIAFTVKVISPEGQTEKPNVIITKVGNVTITATEGAKIYYTTDGTLPNESSTEYTRPISAQGQVVKAIAVSGTLSPSDIVTAYVNVEGTFTWNWNTSGTLQTKPIITGNVKDIVDENTKAVIGKKLTQGFYDKDGIKTVTVEPTGGVAVYGHDEESTISFNIISAAGVSFKPTDISFKAVSLATSSGLMDVYLNSENNSYPLLSNIEAKRDVKGSYPSETDGSFMTDISTIPAADEEWSLKTYIYTLTKAKQWGFSDIVISGMFTGVEYDGVFFNISASAEPAEGGAVSHIPSALKAQAGKRVTFKASPNTGYKFVKWRDYDKNKDVSTEPVAYIESLNNDVIYEAVFEKLPLISFENNVTDLNGVVPSAIYVNANGTLEIPENNTLYKEGYALTAWTDGTKEYIVGQTYSFTSDITLRPVMTQCSNALTDTDAPVTAKWYFDQTDGAPVISGTFKDDKDGSFTYTKCVTVNDTTKIDLPMVFYGAKADNNDARVNFLKDREGNNANGGQLNNDLTLKIPAVYGMVVKMKASSKADYESSPTNPNETYFQNSASNAELSFWYDNAEGSQTAAVGDKVVVNDRMLQYTYKDNASEIYVKIDKAGSTSTYGFFEYLEVVYPQLPEVRTINSITSDLITTLEKVDNAGATEMTPPNENGNTGKRYKEGDNVTITVTAGYGYYIKGLKEGNTPLLITKVEPAADSEKPTKVTANYTVKATSGNITVEYAHLPMAKVRLETVDKTLGTVDFNPKDIHLNFYEKGEDYVQSWFVVGDSVHGSSDAADNYVLKEWIKEGNTTPAVTGPTLSIKVPAAEGPVTYHAYFTLGKQGNIVFDVANAKWLKNGKLTAFSVDSNSTWPENQNNCRSFYIPKYHGLFKTYDSAGNGHGWTLTYWMDSKDSTRYDIGTNNSFLNEGETITLIPVFEENPGGMQNRLNAPVLTYEFGTGAGIRAQKLDLPKNTDTYLCAPVYTEVAENSVIKGHTRDVALWINTGEKGYVRNSGFEEWAAIGPGTTLTIASCAGTTIEILSYAPISSTTIDGVVPTKCHQKGEHEYIYSYTTQNPSPRIPIVIGDDYGYYKWIKAHTLPANRVNLHTVSANEDQGEITKTEVTTTNKDREYITKLEDGGHSIIQGTRVKISFERKFGYVFDKIVDPDKIVNGEPLAVLKVNDTAGKIDANTTVDMVNMNDAKDVMRVNRNTNEENGVISWGKNDDEHVFILRQIEPTEEEKRNGKRTRYEVEFEITTHRNLIFYFKEKPTYYITFNPGMYASGIAPTAKWVEEGDEYVIPKNTTLYYSGYTLHHWESEDGTQKYEIGKKYNAPGNNLRLFPEFEKNTFSLLDEDLTKESTATWNFTHNGGAPDIAYERSSGILVTQLKKDPDDVNSDFIDLKIDLNASDRKDEGGNTIKGKFNNMSDDDRCQINMYSILSFPVTKGCGIALEAVSTISTTSIAGKTSTNGGYTAGKVVTTTWDGSEGTQDVNFQSDGRYYTYFAVTYKPQTIAKPALQSVSFGGNLLTEEQLATLKTNETITLETCPITLDEKGVLVSEEIGKVEATASGSGHVEVVQPTINTPTAVIRLLSAGNILLNTYIVNFTLKAPTSDVEGAQLTPQFQYTEINGVKYNDTNVTVENMPASGYIKVVFDRTMQSVTLPFTDEANNLNETFTAEQGKELIFYYWNLTNKELNYELPGSMFKDIYGNAFKGEFVKHFKTRGTTKEIVHDTFDFIVGVDGTLDDAINAANANEGTDRFLIFVPDGEYQLTGNEPLDNYVMTSDGAWPCDEEGNERNDMQGKNNGRTVVSKANVSIVGQSREGVKIFNHPIVEGISYTSTIHVGKTATDFYAEDISMENQFKYWSSMNAGSGAGRAVVLWDQGQRTVMKNVSMMSWQDTYYSSNSNDDYRGYFENCAIGGVVDWLCGDGNIWFEQCDFVIRDRSGNNLAAPSQEKTQQWGYVFNECNVVPEIPLSQTESLKDKTWTLARPWVSSTDKSPACTFIHTRMGVLPKDHGWGSMGSGALLRFHENHTMDAGGTVLSLGARSLAACAPAAGSDDCVMNDTEASKYTIENVLGGSDSFTPKERTMQIDAQSGDKNLHDVVNSKPWDDQIETDDDRLTWNPHPNALCYFIFKLENGKWNYKTNITETSISLDQLSLGTGTYCVRAANQYGGLGAPTKSVDYQEVKRYSLTIAQLGNLKVDGVPYGWSTICLPYNARVPEGVKVYAATAHNENNEAQDVRDYYMTLTETDYLNKDKGYIVYGPAGDYLFKATSRIGTKPTILRGNSSDYPVSSINNSCYILANKTYGLGFYKFTGTELKPYRAWLPADKVVSDVNIGLSSGAKGIRFVFGDNTDLPTGILNSLYGKPGDGDEDQLYNISGQRVKNPASRGIYIRRGQGKVVMGK